MAASNKTPAWEKETLMKTKIAAGLIALSALAAVPALAQNAPAAAMSTAGALSVDKTPIGELIKNDKAKAALEAALPQIAQYYDQISSMTLAQVAPVSQGAIDDAK